MHESFDYYLECRLRQRNMGLFTADRVSDLYQTCSIYYHLLIRTWTTEEMHVSLDRIKMVTDVGTNVQKRGTIILTGTQLHGETLLFWPIMLHAVLTIKLKVPMLNLVMLVSCLLISLKRTFIILVTTIEFLIMKQSVRYGCIHT